MSDAVRQKRDDPEDLLVETIHLLYLLRSAEELGVLRLALTTTTIIIIAVTVLGAGKVAIGAIRGSICQSVLRPVGDHPIGRGTVRKGNVEALSLARNRLSWTISANRGPAAPGHQHVEARGSKDLLVDAPAAVVVGGTTIIVLRLVTRSIRGTQDYPYLQPGIFDEIER